jgi:hypothetical protein
LGICGNFSGLDRRERSKRHLLNMDAIAEAGPPMLLARAYEVIE